MSIAESAWKKFRSGAALTGVELSRLIAQNAAGIQYLQDRGELGGVLVLARQDQAALEGYRNARKGR